MNRLRACWPFYRSLSQHVFCKLLLAGSSVVGPFEFLVVEVGFVRAFRFQTFGALVFDGVELGQRKVVKVLLSPPDFGVLQNGHRLFGNTIFVLGFSNVVLKNE